MTGMIYTSQRSSLSKKQRAARDALLKEQRAIKNDLRRSNTFTPVMSAPIHRRGDKIPSLDTGIGNAVKKPVIMYTGGNMIGIGQMHKSNAVPIFKQQDAEDIAKMRR